MSAAPLPRSSEAPLYSRFAAAYVRGCRPDLDGGSDDEVVTRGLRAGLRLHRFKRTHVLPRVRKVLGVLHGVGPESLLDVGTGRGAFLWPLLSEFPTLPVTCVDVDPERVRQLGCVAVGGVSSLRVRGFDAKTLSFAEDSFDVATALEVLEHIEDAVSAARELVRVTRRFVVVSVPSHDDDNPQHVHVLSAERLRGMFLEAGALRVEVDGVLNHLVATVRVG